jgi:hypothetical protein
MQQRIFNFSMEPNARFIFRRSDQPAARIAAERVTALNHANGCSNRLKLLCMVLTDPSKPRLPVPRCIDKIIEQKFQNAASHVGMNFSSCCTSRDRAGRTWLRRKTAGYARCGVRPARAARTSAGMVHR